MRLLSAALATTLMVAPATAETQGRVERRWVEAHERFLAGDELRGRGSATSDEATAGDRVGLGVRAHYWLPDPSRDP